MKRSDENDERHNEINSLGDGSRVEVAVEDAIVPGLDVAFPAELSRVDVEEPSLLAVLAAQIT